MALLVLFFTIICLVGAWIYVQEWLRNGKNSFTRGGRVSLGPRNKIRYLKCVKELRRAVDEFTNDCGSMHISRGQCQLLRLECLRLVEPTQPDSILRVSFCAIRRALKLMQDCCTENWLLKAVEFGNCQEHFLEILLDLYRLPIVVKLIGFGGEPLDNMDSEFRSINICEAVKVKINDAWESDKAALRSRVMSEISHGDPDHYLADQLTGNPSLIAPDDIGRYVTQFDFLKTPCIYRGGGGIFVFPVTFRNKEFVIKMRYSKPVAKELEDSQDIQLQKEANIMKECRHPYAVGLLGYWEVNRTEGPKVPLLLMESMECDLKKLIKRNKRWWWGGGFPALDAIKLVLPVAKVMRYLHSIGVVHRDLKPQNILFTRLPWTQHLPEDVSVKLTDFGEAQKVEIAGRAKVGTIGYMDPDVWGKKERVDLYKADVFSFGMVFGEVLTGLSPPEALHCMFDSDDGACVDAKKFYRKLEQEERLPLPKETPKFVKSIVESCWASSPRSRPSFEDICWKLQNTEFLLMNGTY